MRRILPILSEGSGHLQRRLARSHVARMVSDHCLLRLNDLTFRRPRLQTFYNSFPHRGSRKPPRDTRNVQRDIPNSCVTLA